MRVCSNDGNGWHIDFFFLFLWLVQEELLELFISHCILLQPSITNHISSLFILAIESFLLVMTLVLRLSFRTSMPHFSFILYAHFCFNHWALRHLAPNIHVWTLFMLCTLSITTLDSKYSCSNSLYVMYTKQHNTWLQSFIFILLFILRILSVMPLGSEYSFLNIIYVMHIDRQVLFHSQIELII